jgi:hypothetical protein
MIKARLKNIVSSRTSDFRETVIQEVVIHPISSLVCRYCNSEHSTYSSGDKIKNNAEHLLLEIAVTEENSDYRKVDKWSLGDLSKLAVRLKNEFNASKTDLMEEKAKIICS